MGKSIKVKNIDIGQGRPKICAMVIGSNENDILGLAARSNEINCDLVEFRADHFDDILDFDKAKDICKKVRTACKKPIIFTCRRK